MKTFDQLSVIGLREWIAFPELGMVGLRAKIDTGASTSSLHASDIVPFERDGEKYAALSQTRAESGRAGGKARPEHGIKKHIRRQ